MVKQQCKGQIELLELKQAKRCSINESVIERLSLKPAGECRREVDGSALARQFEILRKGLLQKKNRECRGLRQGDLVRHFEKLKGDLQQKREAPPLAGAAMCNQSMRILKQQQEEELGALREDHQRERARCAQALSEKEEECRSDRHLLTRCTVTSHRWGRQLHHISRENDHLKEREQKMKNLVRKLKRKLENVKKRNARLKNKRATLKSKIEKIKKRRLRA